MSLNVGELQVQQLMALGFSVATWADHIKQRPHQLHFSHQKHGCPNADAGMKMIEHDIWFMVYTYANPGVQRA